MPLSDRWGLVTEIINRWWPPLTPDDGVSMEEIEQAELRLGHELPMALREWYLLAGRRKDFIGNEDYIRSIDEIEVIDGYLVFCNENQCVVIWGVALDIIEESDPQVTTIEYETENRWPTPGTMSQFIFDMVVMATCQSGLYQWSGRITNDQRAVLEQHYELLHSDSGGLNIVLGNDDCLIDLLIRNNPEHFFVSIAARTREAALKFSRLPLGVGVTLCHQAEDWSHEFSDACRDVHPFYIVRPMDISKDRPVNLPECHLESTKKHKTTFIDDKGRRVSIHGGRFQ